MSVNHNAADEKREVIKNISDDISKLMEHYTFSFDDTSYKGDTLACTMSLMVNDKTGDEQWMPECIKTPDGTIVTKFDHPGWSPRIVEVITTDLISKSVGGNTNA